MEEKNRLENLEEIEKKYKARNKYINDFQKEKYDRVICLLPKGQKEKITKRIKEKGLANISDYLRSLINADLKTAAGTDPEQNI